MIYECISCHQKYDKKGSLSRHHAHCTRFKQEAQKRRTKYSLATEIIHVDNTPIAEGSKEAGIEDVMGFTRDDEVGPGALDGLDVEMVDPIPEPPPVQKYRPSGLPRRHTRLPKRYRDLLPVAPPIVEQPVEPEQPPMPTPPPVIPIADKITLTTDSNSFGVYRVYNGRLPSHNPEENFSVNQVADGPSFMQSRSEPDALPPGPFTRDNTSNPKANVTTEHPFTNDSTFNLMSWFYNGSNTKSLHDLDNLVNDVLLAPNFKPEDLSGFDATKASRQLDNFVKIDRSSKSDAPLKDGWLRAPISIRLPHDKIQQSEDNAPLYELDLLYRKPIEVIKAAYQEQRAAQYHATPFEEYWKPSPTSPPERIYSELYNCDAFLEEHEKVSAAHAQSDDSLETVIAALMVWSDATQLTNFGNASSSLWPVYLFFGNQSKYTRAKPSEFAAHHLAYIPKLDDEIQDMYRKQFGESATADMLTYLRREVMHAVWRLLLDDEFMDAYVNGIVIEFHDGVKRRVFPRFFTYSADYPEKVLLASIKYLGNCPCPRCLITKDRIHEIGTKRDKQRREKLSRVDNDRRKRNVELARQLIFDKGIRPGSKFVANLLDEKSLTPNRNAFSERLGPHGFDFYSLFVVDLLHELELGVWKATFTHLMRILHAQGGDTISILNERYRKIPTFGSAIRKFNHNVSGMKRLAARDFEDLLQCAIPAFEGLLPQEHDTILLDLLFELATWHSLAKLRLHTESTITALEHSTTRLGAALRRFVSITCSAYVTRELPSEEAARGRRNAALAKKRGEGSGNEPASAKKQQKGKQRETGPKIRKFSLNTYKLHALGDYPPTIRSFGTADGYSTQTGELEHRRCKRYYPIVHKGKRHFVKGIAFHISRERLLNNLSNLKPAAQDENIGRTRPGDHFQMSEDTRHPLKLNMFLREHEDDPAVEGFLSQLKDHILGRIHGHQYEGDYVPFSEEERAQVRFRNHIIYQHKVLRVNYTTYDMRREQDSLNPSRQANIVVLAPEGEDHPYWYARIIGVYHAVVSHPKLPEPTHMDFVRVRWYGLDPDPRYRFGWKSRRLPRIGFIDDTAMENTSPAFGFIDPANIMRGVHLIPAFKDGLTSGLLDTSPLARQPHEGDYDWNFFYINIFCDRDMVMRFRGGGVGHSSTRDATNHFLTDRHPTDMNSGPEEPDTMLDDEMEAIPNMATVPDVDELGDGDLADEAEADYGYSNGDSDDGEDGGEEEAEEKRQGLAEDEGEEDEVEQLGFARF